ncbi:LuxR C-terminal-related transcriptional regulator [Streptomyces sp. TX20-6-3]|uniref:LuxR C-terminal-related transcriptional regulator n=1 Tax=Streptomyces sp. TX20-6-3 TaxID=3028705 RepID=UPI0029A41ACF|nr:LuxR C-terminal-related transcriptional regulator [Streptomyces sp. TX20-6-3]MDX2565301.1 LuxR C-terminal-related transcriptional regulator [Streptomyces sp. TX20-6-3]
MTEWPTVGRGDQIEAFSSFLESTPSRGFVIYGPVGVGKSHLARKCAALAEMRGVRVGRACATPSVSRIPLGSIAHLLPEHISDMEPSAAFALAGKVLGDARRSGREQLIFVDDLHLLDGASAALLRHLMESQAVKVLGTIRTGEAPSSILQALTSADEVHHIELHECTLGEVEAVLQAALGGIIGQQTVREFHKVSGGNLLYLRELVLGALSSRALSLRSHTWELEASELPKTAKLTELIRSRLANAPKDGREFLAVLALCGTVSLHMAESLAPIDTLAELEQQGLICTTRTRRRTLLTIAHPLYGDLIAGEIPAETRQEILLSQAASIANHGSRRRSDALKIATWELAATGTTAPERLTQAAVLARHAHDYNQVVSLLSALPADQHDAQTLLMLGESLFRTGQPDKADEVLREASLMATEDAERLKIAFVRTMVLLWHGARTTEALEANSAARNSLTGKNQQRMLKINEGFLRVLAGEPAAGLILLQELDADPQSAPDLSVWLRGALMKPAALALTGQTHEAIVWARQAYGLQCQYSNEAILMHPTGQLVSLVLGLAESGNLHEAEATGNHAWALLGNVRDPVSSLWLAYYQGHAAWLAGKISSARSWFAESVSQARTHRNFLGYRLAMSGLSAATALMGNIEDAEKIEAEAREYEPIGYCRGQERLGEAWVLVGKGRIDDARGVLVAAADGARESGFVTSEILLLTDIARLGAPETVSRRLHDLADRTDSPFARLRADLATGLAEQDPAKLIATAAALNGMGANLLAAEAATASAAAWQQRGELRSATAATRQAKEWLVLCGGVRTPLSSHSTRLADLTEREAEIARLVVGGATSREVANTLFLSIRTVDNHLQRIYRKLGIGTRQELRDNLVL